MMRNLLFLYFIFSTIIIIISAGRIKRINFNRKLPANLETITGILNASKPNDHKIITCKNNESRAEDCFDYFKLSLYWPKTFAYAAQKIGLNIKQDKLVDKWIIHGLWAQKFSGQPSKNCKRKNMEFHFGIFKNTMLSDKLHSIWFSILNTHNFNDESFWKHEWDAHGSCSSRIPALNTVEKYFAKSIQIYEELDINSKLFNRNFKPGFNDTLGNIIDYYNTQIGKKILVTLIANLKLEEWYLKEIHICYDLSLKLIDCPDARHFSNDIKEKKVKYLDTVPI